MGWGQQPYFSEDNSAGQQIFDAHFTVPTSSYRAYRFAWNAQPPTLPALAISPSTDGSTAVYASWNGATDVAVLAGARRSGAAEPRDHRRREQDRVRDPYHGPQRVARTSRCSR